MHRIKYRRDEDMKDSKVEWLRQVSTNWDANKLKFIAEVKNGATPQTSIQRYWDGSINWFTPIDFSKESLYESARTITMQGLNSCGTNLVPRGSILITCRAPIGNFGIIQCGEAAFNQGCKAVIPMKAVNKFIYYLLLAGTVFIQSRGKGTTFMELSSNDLKNLVIEMPDITSQQKIANFLDTKTAQFDSIISKKELLIKKLEEAKKSLIFEVVTGKVKIVDGEMVPRKLHEMKDSGVEWLGMVPKDWDVKRVKNIFSLRNERNQKSMDEVQILSLYTALGVKKQEDIENKTGNIVRTVLDYKIVYPKDIVVNIILAWMGAIGVSKNKGVISPAYDIYKPHENTNSNYYSHLFRTSKFAGECFKYGRGIMLMRWRTYSDQFMSIYCCCPNKKEQDQIAEFIDGKCQDMEFVVEKYKSQIKKLQQAKQSLISEAVTGKIDLRDWEIIEEGDLH